MKIQITQKQAHQFNFMRHVLKRISKDYMTPAQIRKDTKGDFGLDFEEMIEMSYENIQTEAAAGCKNVKAINVPLKTT